MSFSVWKYEFNTGAQTFNIPVGAEFLDVQVQHGKPVMWFAVNPSSHFDVRSFELVATGEEIDDRPGKYLGTIQERQGMLIWHVYETTQNRKAP